MTISAPVFTIYCDEHECSNNITLVLDKTSDLWMKTGRRFYFRRGLYELRAVTERYAFFGGETLPNGKHRCATCRAKLAPIEPLNPSEIMAQIAAIAAARRDDP